MTRRTKRRMPTALTRNGRKLFVAVFCKMGVGVVVVLFISQIRRPHDKVKAR